MKILTLLVGLPVLLAGGAASATLIIDDFEVGPFSLATPDSPISQTGGFSVAEFRAVPEPSTALLFASALMMLALQRRLA